MAYEIPGMDITLKSTGDMSSHQYKAIRASSSVTAGGAALVATRGGLVTGVWQDNSSEASHDGRIRLTGISKVVAGDSSAQEVAITEGSKVVCSSQGAAVASTGSGQHLLGIALGSLSTGSTGIIPVMLTIGAIST